MMMMVERIRRNGRRLRLLPIRRIGSFRSGYGTNDHLLLIKNVIEKSVEFSKPLALIFVDYEKAFDSLNYQKMLAASYHRYINIMKHIYQNAT